MSYSVIHEQDYESDQNSDQMQFSNDGIFVFRYDIEQNYLDKDLINSPEYLCESFLFNQGFVQSILKRVLKRAEERQLERDVPIHSINYVEYVSSTLAMCCVDYGQTDLDNCIPEEDPEPILASDDPWRRNNVAVTTKDQDGQSQTTLDQLNNTKSQFPHSRQSIIRPHYEGSKKHIKVEPPVEQEPKPVPLEWEIDDDEYHDKLRNVKLYDQKKKMEAEQKKQTEKLRIPKPERGETGPRKYIYDFDGTLLAAKILKVEKLSPANYMVGFHVIEPKAPQDATTKLSPKRKKEPQADPTDAIPKTKLNNKILDDRKENTKEIVGDRGIKPSRDLQFPYDNFNMGSGVTLFFESKMKEGQRSQMSDSVEALSNKLAGNHLLKSEQSIKTSTDQLRLTKTEYQLVTQYGGTLKPMAKVLSNVNVPSDATQPQINSFEPNSVTMNPSTVSLKAKPKIQFDTNTKSRSPPQTSNSAVKLNNKFLSKLVGDEDTPLTRLEKQKVSGLKAEPITHPQPKNPIDQFNQTLLQSKEWGKQGGASTLPPIKTKIVKHIDTIAHKSSLEQLYKMPRERLNAQNQRGYERGDSSEEQTKAKNRRKKDKIPLQTFYTTHSKFSDNLRYT